MEITNRSCDSASWLIQASPQGALLYDPEDASIIETNQKLRDLFECDSEEEFALFSGNSYLNLIAKEDRRDVRILREQALRSRMESTADFIYRIRTKTGRLLDIESHGSLVTAPDGRALFLCFMNKARSELTRLPESVDRLTGLLTREQFFIFASRFMEHAIESGSYKEYSILYINIRNFKYYNLKYGVPEGNKMLTYMADLLHNDYHAELSARFGSDHFVAITKQQDLKSTLKNANHYFDTAYGAAGIKMKVGIYHILDTATSIETACDFAKVACDSIRDVSAYYKVYDEEIQEKLEIESYVLQNFDRILQEKKIQIYFQPVIRTINGSLCGMEALARWIDPEHKTLSPVDFIPALEHNQLITKLDLYVLHEICAIMDQRLTDGTLTVPVSINLSRQDFLSCNIFEEVEREMDRHNIPRDMLCIEITESMVMDNPNIFQREIKRFRRAGYQIWMDDFGSGYSSLNVLRDYEIDQIKLDMLFLRNFDEKSIRMIRSIISMAKELKIQTLAEGVSDLNQYEFLRDIGCEKVQGFLFSPPVSDVKFRELYENQRDQVESRPWNHYYSKVGEVNFITDKTLAIVNYDGDRFSHIYVNKAYREIWKEIHIQDEEMARELINSKSSPLYTQYRSLLGKLKLDGKHQTIEYVLNKQYIRLRARLLSSYGEHKLFQCEIINLTHGEDTSHVERMDYIFRLMYAMYDTVHVVDLNEEQLEIVVPSNLLDYSNELLGTARKSFKTTKVINEVAMNLIAPEDREEYLEFTDISTLEERIRINGKHYMTKVFRTKRNTSNYQWCLHTIQMVPSSNQIIYSSRFVPHIFDQMKSTMIGWKGHSETSEDSD